MAIKLLITDFDGTLVDTFEANYHAYAKTFENHGMTLDLNVYRECFGLRFDDFMEKTGIYECKLREIIRKEKAEVYPEYFNFLRINLPLLTMIREFRRSGRKTAVASTARSVNLHNALHFIGAENDFDLILAGESVKRGKPDPEIYLSVLDKLGVSPKEALVFEDSLVGFVAAQRAGINYLPINKYFFGNDN